MIISAINSNADLQRYLFLFIGGITRAFFLGVHRTATHFEIHRAFTAHQLFTIQKEASHTVILIEHDATLYDGAWNMIAPITGALRELAHEATVIL